MNGADLDDVVALSVASALEDVTVELLDEANLLVDENVLQRLRTKGGLATKDGPRQGTAAPSGQLGSRTSGARAGGRDLQARWPSPSSVAGCLARRIFE
jgi:hypothetical protein